MFSAHYILILVNLVNIYNVAGHTAHTNHSGSLIYEQYAARETELEQIVSVKLSNKFEEKFENTLEERIFLKVKANLETKAKKKLDDLFSCCPLPVVETEAPKVSTETRVIETEGNSVTLNCTILAGKPTPSIQWQYGDLDIYSDFGRYRLMPNGALEISALKLNDSGDYICVAVNTVDIAEKTVKLHVKEKLIAPQVIIGSDVTAKEKEDATLRCSATGKPAPKITWLFGSNIIDRDVDRYRLHSDGALEVTTLNLGDSGGYTCVANNKAGTAQATVTLTVKELQIAPEALKTDEHISEMENKKITLRCNFNGKPAPKITWSFGGMKIESDVDRYRLQPDGALQITFLYRNDTGVYTCEAQNPAGTAQTTVTLTVNWNNDWCPTTSATAASMGGTAVVAGVGICGYHDLWVIRARHGTGLIPGKYDVHTTVASYAMDGSEHTTSVFEIFCSTDRVQWVANTYGIPSNAIIGGFTALGPSGDPLYVGRAVQGSYLTSGMIWNNVLYIPYSGGSYQHTSFEVLCRV